MAMYEKYCLMKLEFDLVTDVMHTNALDIILIAQSKVNKIILDFQINSLHLIKVEGCQIHYVKDKRKGIEKFPIMETRVEIALAIADFIKK
jgi:hypothetical protein